MVTTLTFVPGLAEAAETEETAAYAGPTQGIVQGSRIADVDTHDDYLSQLLGGDIYGSLVLDNKKSSGNNLTFSTSGTRYAGRLWADKSVFANGQNSAPGSSTNSKAWNSTLNQLNLSMATDGYRGSVATNDDFMHVYSVLGSSQVQNTYPPNPIDLVIVFDMSGSMACAADGMTYGESYKDAYNNSNVPSSGGVEKFIDINGEEKYGITPQNRIKYSRIQATVDAMNQTIDSLMEQNIQNRVAVVGYGASSAVLMPLHHYTPQTIKGGDGEEIAKPYITVDSMQQLLPAAFDNGWATSTENRGYFTSNVDGAYTLKVDAKWTAVKGEVEAEGQGAVEGESGTEGGTEGGTESGMYSNGFYGEGFSDADTVYIGCLTSTQNGVYLGFKQLADTKLTTYEEQVNNTKATLPRIPSLILMTDGGANFAYRDGVPQGWFGNLSGQWDASLLWSSCTMKATITSPLGAETTIDSADAELMKKGIEPPLGDNVLEPGSTVEYTISCTPTIDYGGMNIKGGTFYIPINWVFDTSNGVTASATVGGSETKCEIKTGTIANETAEERFHAGAYYDYDGYVEVNLGDVNAGTEIKVTFEATVRSELNKTEEGEGVQYNGGYVTTTGLLFAEEVLRGTESYQKPATALAGSSRIPLKTESNSDKSYFATSWDYQLGFVHDQDQVGNNGTEWYNYYLPGGESHSLNANSSRSVPNSQIYNYSWLMDGIFASYPSYANAGVLYQTDGSGDQQSSVLATPGTTLEVLMTASYMKTAAQKNYQQGWTSAEIPENALTTGNNVVKVFSVGVDLDDTSFWSRARLYATMDPANYFIADFDTSDVDTSVLGADDVSAGIASIYTKRNPNGTVDPNSGQTYMDRGFYATQQEASIHEIEEAYDFWKNWSNLNSPLGEGPIGASEVLSNEMGTFDGAYLVLPINISRLPENGFDYTAGSDANNPESDDIVIKNQDVIDHINYSDQFYDVSSEEVGGIFQQILSLIQGQIFDPVAGVNAAGATDSVTYFDPVGKYMEVKNPYTSGTTGNQPIDADLQMVHLGKMYGLVRTGVYDYQWNNQYMVNNGDQSGTFKSGWYKGNPTAGPDGGKGSNQGVQYGGTGLPDGCATAQAAWEAGWVYRLDFSTTQQFVSTLEGTKTVNELTDIQKNTVYTMYRFDWVQKSQTYNTSGDVSDEPYHFGNVEDMDNMSERQLWLMNPAYAESAAASGVTWHEDENGLGYVIDNPTQATINESVANGGSAPIGAYRVSDFRVWVEDSGDFVSEDELVRDIGYDEALYFDLPSAAIPLQVADLTVDTAGRTLEYLTNLGGENDNFELVQWDAANKTEETSGGATGHQYTITFSGEPLKYVAGTVGDHDNTGLNYLVIDNSTGAASSEIEATQVTAPISEDACTITTTLTGDQSLVVTNVPSGVSWTVQATGDGGGDAIWTGDGLPAGEEEVALKGTTIASTSVVATYLQPGNEPAQSGTASLTVQNRVVNAGSGDVSATNIVPIAQTYPFTVKFTEGTGQGGAGQAKVPTTVSFINSMGKSGEMTLSAGVTPSFILNSGDSITFYGLPDGLQYEVVPATALTNPLTWITSDTSTEGNADGKGALGQGNTLVTAQYTDTEAQAYSQSYYYAQTTPCRLFYSVGVEDEVLYPSGNVNVGALDLEYVQTHTETGRDASGDRYSRVYFLSNWFDKDNEATKDSGVPATTFSPSADNRYYAFQKNLPLFIAGSEEPDPKILGEKDGVTTSAEGAKLMLGGKEYEAVTNISRDNSQLTADGWYYILIEYYLPSANGGGQFVRMALPRQGSQFGANVNTNVEGDSEGEYLCWYNPSSGTVENSLAQKPEGVGWVIATKVGGLRTGNMENNIRAKTGNNVNASGEEIPGGPTQTATDYFYPTAASGKSSGTGSGSGSGSGSGMEGGEQQFNNEINVYLGNNGKLYISDTKLLVTKLVVDPKKEPEGGSGEGTAAVEMSTADPNMSSLPLTFTKPLLDTSSDVSGEPDDAHPGDTLYDYQVFVDGATGVMDATVVSYDRWSELWRQVLSTIDARVNDQQLLFASDGNQLAVVDGNGNPWKTGSSGAEYYVYLGKMAEAGTGSGGAGAYRVYSNAENNTGQATIGKVTIYVPTSEGLSDSGSISYADATNDMPAGTRVYSASGVVLVPKATVDEYPAKHNGEAWSYPGSDSESGEVKPPSFTFATLFLDHDYGLRSGINVDSSYSLDAKYLTRTLYFGYEMPTEKQEEDIAEGQDYKDVLTPLSADGLYDKTTFANVRPEANYTKYNVSTVDSADNEVNSATVASNTAEFQLRSGEGLALGGLTTRSVYRVTESNEATRETSPTELVLGRNVQYGNYVDYAGGTEYDPSETAFESHHAWNILGNASTAGYYGFTNVDSGTKPNQPPQYQSIDSIAQSAGYTVDGKDMGPNTTAYFNDNDGVFSIYGDTDSKEEAAQFFNAPVTPVPVELSLQKTVKMEGGSSTGTIPEFTFTVTPGAENPASDPIRDLKGYKQSETGGTGYAKFSVTPAEFGKPSVVEIFNSDTGKFTEPGTYTYTVREVVPNPGTPGWSYDPTVYTVTVEVTPEYVKVNVPDTRINTIFLLTGDLVAEVSYASSATGGENAPYDPENPLPFENTYDVGKTTANVFAGKSLAGGELVNGAFMFNLKGLAVSGENPPMPMDKNDQTVESVTNFGFNDDGTGIVPFPSITYGKAGTYYYKLSESPSTEQTVITDTSSYLVVVTVTGDGTEESPYVATVAYYNWDPSWDENNFVPPSDDNLGNPVTPNPTFNNYQDLIVEKVVEGDDLMDDTFKFTITLTNADGTPLSSTYHYSIYNGDGTPVEGQQDVEWDASKAEPQGVLTFNLMDHQFIRLSGLPQETQYTVKETQPDLPSESQSVTTTWTQGAYQTNDDGSLTPLQGPVNPSPNQNVLTGADRETGEAVSASTYNYTQFVNSTEEEPPPPPPPGSNYGNLTVVKRTTGEGTPTGQTFNFTVTLSQPLNGPYGDMTFTDGVAHLTLASGESATARNLPPGITYTVTEDPVDNWQVSWVGDTGTIVANTTAQATATNTWAPGTVSLTGEKTLVGGELQAGQFSFQLTPDPSNPQPDPVAGTTVTNGADGTIQFFNATFTQAGTYRYTVSEVKGDDPQIHYDETVYHVTITVTEDENGQLTATQTIEPNGEITFTNTVGSGSLELRKVVVGEGAPTDQTFTFRVVLDPALSGTFGGVTFTDGVGEVQLKAGESVTIDGLPTGTTYTVTEVPVPNWDVTWEGDTGTIEANATATATATNTWSPGHVSLDGWKRLLGAELQDGQFQFTVTPAEGNPQPDPVAGGTVTNGPDGRIHFFDATYTEEGTWNYTISEVKGDDPDIHYDETVYHVTVTVTEGEDGQLLAEVTITPTGEIVFTNTTGTGDLTLAKVVTGEGAPTDRTFTFRVTLDPPITGTYDGVTFTDGVAEVELRAGQSLTIHGLPAGTTYSVEELDATGWTVTWEGQTGTIQEGANVTATAINAWTPDHVHLEAEKRLLGGELAEGQFQFRITPGEGNPQPDPIGERTATNAADGSIVLVDDAVFTVPGTYTYTVSEVAGDDPSISYDATVYTVTVTVTQDEATGQLHAEVSIAPDPGAGNVMTFTNVQEGTHKVETTPGDGKPVNPGDTVTYQISYRNGSDTPGTVTIVDPVDGGLDFVSASDGGIYDPNGRIPAGMTVGYGYHGTVTWTIPDVAPGASGTVTVTFRVNAYAEQAGVVRDQALVDWSNDHEPWTPTPEVPTNPFQWPTIVPQTSDGRPLILPTVLVAIAAVAAVAGLWMLFRRRPRHG